MITTSPLFFLTSSHFFLFEGDAKKRNPTGGSDTVLDKKISKALWASFNHLFLLLLYSIHPIKKAFFYILFFKQFEIKNYMRGLVHRMAFVPSLSWFHRLFIHIHCNINVDTHHIYNLREFFFGFFINNCTARTLLYKSATDRKKQMERKKQSRKLSRLEQKYMIAQEGSKIYVHFFHRIIFRWIQGRHGIRVCISFPSEYQRKKDAYLHKPIFLWCVLTFWTVVWEEESNEDIKNQVKLLHNC